jgi:hypothetical protein
MTYSNFYVSVKMQLWMLRIQWLWCQVGNSAYKIQIHSWSYMIRYNLYLVVRDGAPPSFNGWEGDFVHTCALTFKLMRVWSKGFKSEE